MMSVCTTLTPMCSVLNSFVGLPTIFSSPFLTNQKSASGKLILKSHKSPIVIKINIDFYQNIQYLSSILDWIARNIKEY